MSDCIFCKIANGEIPSATLYEDDDFRAILDLGPATRGHALLLPKKHYADIFEMPAEEAAKAFAKAKQIAEALMKALNADGIQIVQNNKPAAGQTVFHVHIHMIPAYSADGRPGAIWEPGSLAEEDKTGIPEKIREFL